MKAVHREQRVVLVCVGEPVVMHIQFGLNKPNGSSRAETAH